ncbi:MAG: ABC transporter permease [Chromatiales bacterium]|nr:ABC transporter permease [Chromatiales bacterium]
MSRALIAVLIQRVFSVFLVGFGVLVLVFALLHLVPGDPVDAMLGETARPADREALRERLGLDQSLPVQFARYLGGLVRGDLGRSLYSDRAVTEMLAERLPATLELGLAALLLALSLALPLGILAALHPDGTWDRTAMGFSLLGVAVPNFWLGPVLILVFSLGLGWFPVSGRDAPGSLVLPAFTLGTAMAAILARMVRSSLLEVLGEDYIRTARAKGLSPATVVLRHGLRNALLPVITLVGLQLGALLSGAVITETVFAWPGIGSLLVEHIQRRDYPVVQGCVLLIAMGYVVANQITDLFYTLADPRLRERT